MTSLSQGVEEAGARDWGGGGKLDVLAIDGMEESGVVAEGCHAVHSGVPSNIL